MPISSNYNKITIGGEFNRDEKFRLIATMHNTVYKKEYQDFELDFSNCTKAYSAEMLAVSAQCQKYWKDGIDIKLSLPTDSSMRRLFLNTNWAHLIDPRSHDSSRFRGYTHAPALRYTNGKEQTLAVDKMLDILMAAISHFQRDEIRYIEWALNEITDNVINHAQSPVGGFVQVTNHRQKKQIEIAVCDSGLGIPATLKQGHQNIISDTEALEHAIKEGVTRDKKIGQGNGLYGSWSITKKTGGSLQIFSGHARLQSDQSLEIRKETVPTNGTLVVAKIGYSTKFDLSDALVFSGKRYIPTDYIDTHFEEDTDGNVTFNVNVECNGFGSRAAGEPARRKLSNIIGLLKNGQCIVNFSDVHLVSSSFADEFIGKLFVELGPLEFMKKVKLTNIDPLVQNLIDRAISQRVTEGL